MSQQSASTAQSPAQEEPQEASERVRFFDLQALASFRNEGPSIQVISESRTARIVLLSFKAGQQLKEHRTTNQLFVQALRGHVIFTVKEQSIKLEVGAALQVEAAMPHSVTAPVEAVLLLTMIADPALISIQRESGTTAGSDTQSQA